MSANDRLLKPDETAARLGCTRRTLENRIALGDAPPSIRIGKLRRFPESALNDWIAAKLAAATADTTLVSGAGRQIVGATE